MFSDHFAVIDDAVAPAPWMQLRSVKSVSTPAVSKSYDPSDGWTKNDVLQTITTAWTNDTPVAQLVHGEVTTDSCQVVLQCRSRGYLATSHGIAVDDNPTPDIPMTVVSQMGVGTSIGTGGLLNLGGAFGISELDWPASTAPLMPHVTGLTVVQPGETFHARIEVRFQSVFWENTQIDGGNSDTESKILAGGLRLDLYAVPSIGKPPTRVTPTVVGGAGNVNHDINFNNGITDTRTSVLLPSGVEAGDTLVAVVVNNIGLASDISAVEDGWTLLHSRNEGIGGFQDVHMKIYIRTATNSEPYRYRWRNGLFAEEIAVLFALRDAAPYEADIENWAAASTLSRFRRFEQHVAPTINRRGQLLLGVSYLSKGAVEAAVTQTPPDGMTELIDIPGDGGALAIAVLPNPPSPTGARKFTPNYVPLFTGHAICAAVLVPGVLDT